MIKINTYVNKLIAGHRPDRRETAKIVREIYEEGIITERSRILRVAKGEYRVAKINNKGI